MHEAWPAAAPSKLVLVARIAVIGAGLIGLSCAWQLARERHRVALYDSTRSPRAASWAAAGMLAPHHEAEDDGPLWRLCAAGWEAWPDFLAELEVAPAELDWRAGGGWIRAESAEELAREEASRAWLRARGVEVLRLAPSAWARACPGLDPGAGALWLPGGQVDPRRLLACLQSAAHRLGVEDRTGIPVTALAEGALRTADGAAQAYDAIVLASGAWTPALAELAGLSLSGSPIKGQLVRLSGPLQLPGFVRAGARYLLTRRDGSVIVGSTMVDAGFDDSEDPQAIAELAAWARGIAPVLGGARITEHWAGLRPRLADGLPRIARVRPWLLLATGHFRNGVLLAPLTGRIIADLVAERRSPWSSVLGSSCAESAHA
ncbi:MAG: FAD-dependent oxidoreductase [Planctomycetota bacterium]|nr:FAD-dependent oxidoreductase [Planctomycetota bacterium]MCX8040711.1 FAD-dependent oxidoreductase [Planctomycetota bacterium]MDW8372326.1 FAD-dependent oxidoreductase [Planctomycetota bacterium]